MGMGLTLVSRRGPPGNPTVPLFPGPAPRKGDQLGAKPAVVTARSETVVPSQWEPSPHLPRTGEVMGAHLAAISHTGERVGEGEGGREGDRPDTRSPGLPR